jgi:hypothetical protein
MKKIPQFYYVYCITNKILNKQYVGSRICYKSDPLNDGYWGSSKYLHADYNLYGKENFTKEIIQLNCLNKINMLNIETDYILRFNTLEPNGYNRFLPNKKIGFHMGGRITSDHTKLKISNSEKGKILSVETKLKMSKSKIGKYKEKTFEERFGTEKAIIIKEKMSAKLKGRIAWNKNKKMTEEQTKNMCKPKSDQHKHNMGLTKLGNTNFLGKKHSVESKLKMKNSHLKQ